MSTIAQQKAADLRYAVIAKRYGMKNSLRTAWEARAAEIGPALAFAMVEQESLTGANVFGHDGTSSIPVSWRGTLVTRSKYRAYKAKRSRFGMQGVGPLQLTWWETQDQADRLGGCYVPKYNLRVGFRTLRTNINAHHSKHDGIRAYNGAGPAAEAYAKSVLAREAKWHKRLYGR